MVSENILHAAKEEKQLIDLSAMEPMPHNHDQNDKKFIKVQ